MNDKEIITLVIAILGVLHGPLIPAIVRKTRNKQGSK